MKLITTAHGYVEKTWKTPVYYGLDRFVLKRYDHVICVSEDLREFMLDRGIAPERCTYIPNGIDTDEYRRTEPSEAAKKRAPGYQTVGWSLVPLEDFPRKKRF